MTNLSALSIRTRIYLLVAAIILPFAAHMGLQAYYGIEERVRDSMDNNRVLAEIVANSLDQTMHDHFILAQRLAQRSELKNLGTTTCNTLFANFTEQHIGYVTASYVDASGMIRCSATAGGHPPEPTSFYDIEWFQRVMSKKMPIVSTPYMGRVLKQWLVVVSAPVLDEQGNFNGAANLIIDLGKLQPVQDKKLPKNTFIMVIDKEGSVVTRSSDLEKWVGKNLKGTDLIDSALHLRNGAARAPSVSGVDTIIGVAEVPEIGWFIIVGSRADEVLAPAMDDLWNAIASGLLIIMAILCLAYFIARSLILPILKLAAVTRKITKTRANAQVSESGPSEISNLAKNFNAMLMAQQAAEAALTESKRFLEAIIEHSNALIYAKDRDSTYLLVNRKWQEVTGISREEAIGKTDMALFLEPEARQFIAQDRQVVDRGETLEIEETIERIGTTYYCLSNKFPLRDNNNLIIGVCGVSTDVTDRIIAQRTLAQSEHFMRALIDILPGMVGYWTYELRCAFSNSAYLAWFGKTQEEMQGIRMQDLLGDELFKKNEPFIRAALRGETQTFERTLTKADGSKGFTWAHYIPDRDGERIRGFFILVSDITELKQAQLKLEDLNHTLRIRTHEAESASLAKSHFLSNMSHEIRTPMNAIMGFLQLLQQTSLTERQRNYVQDTHRAAHSLLQIINDILDFSKIESGKLEIEQAPFHLEEVLLNLSVLLSTAAQNKNVEVLFDVDTSVPQTLLGDAMRVQQVLLNLAENAVKFTQQGEVVLSIKAKELTQENASIEFSVRDTGIGIPTDKLAGIFESFTQAEASTSRRFGGTGLGLSISQHLVQAMGGKLAVESTSGVGSRFYFTLTFARASTAEEAARVAQRAPAPADSAALRILIVDDNPVANEILGEMVASIGWHADIVSSGSAALERLQQNAGDVPHYDAILLDWMMPEMDGWETAQRIRVLQPSEHSPLVIMVSAHGREVLAERMGDGHLALDGFLVKPVTPSMIFDAIASASVRRTKGIDRRTSARRSRHRLNGLHLLVVEDNPTNQQVAKVLLTNEGAEVQVANNGREGIKCIVSAKRPFNAVLMDIQMPVMDGFEATRILREEIGLVHLPIIAMTANVMDSDRQKSLAAGMNDHIGKPFDIGQLVATILRNCKHTHPAPSPVDNVIAPGTPALIDPHGFSVNPALERIGYNRALYSRMVDSFQQDQQSICERFHKYLNQGDTRAAGRELHTLKGLASTLGAQELAEYVRSCEARLKAQNIDDDLSDVPTHLEALLVETIKKLNQIVLQFKADAIPEKAAVGPAAVDPAAIIALLDQLDPLLAVSNLRALEVHATLKQAYGTALCKAFSTAFEALDHAVNRLDFAAALTASHSLRNVLLS